MDEGAALDQGLQELGLALDATARARLLEHAALIRRWSRSYNLVSRGDLGALVTRHTLDSLALHRFVQGERVLDVGSGAGFPGLALAIALGGTAFTLLDSAGKRTRFLEHVVRTLGLHNVRVERGRVEQFEPDGGFDTVCSRAFASLADFAGAVRTLAAPGTRLLAAKGRYPEEELDALPAWVTVESVTKYHVPLLKVERHVVIMRRAPESAATPV